MPSLMYGATTWAVAYRPDTREVFFAPIDKHLRRIEGQLDCVLREFRDQWLVHAPGVGLRGPALSPRPPSKYQWSHMCQCCRRLRVPFWYGRQVGRGDLECCGGSPPRFSRAWLSCQTLLGRDLAVGVEHEAAGQEVYLGVHFARARSDNLVTPE